MKCNIIFIPISKSKKGILTLYFHIASEEIDIDTCKTITDIYERVIEHQALSTEYFISSNINIRNKETGEIRIYRGHFSLNELYVQTLSEFKNFHSTTSLYNTLYSAISDQNLTEKLIIPYKSSRWVFNSIRNIVICFQIYTKANNLEIIKNCYKKYYELHI